MEARQYEMFVCWAFGLTKGACLNREGDPAEVADSACFNFNNLAGVKAAIAYSIMIYIKEISSLPHINTAELTYINGFVSNVINASTLKDITKLMTDFEVVIDKYFQRTDGKISFL